MDQDISLLITSDLEKKISDCFLIFDHHGNKTVDVREIGTIIRYLGCVPSEDEINEIISATESEDSSGTITLSKFLPHVTQLLAEHKMEAASPEKLLAAFKVLDVDSKGYLTKEYMSKVMMQDGEPFTQEELDEMLSSAVDAQTGKIPYEYYINSLMVDI
ncbi:Dynein regulatory complex protein 8 [Pseudolycoriella hygida]|uniref:Dynein regulatory complex protein 8 n=1 Tax=Pseudolycoriella hygida TaxID=35572 RepID=A0A9Q0NG71_9DIPT|nr:Dynein regulatory complex protein 8 [Pseudolycoriella hygida]